MSVSDGISAHYPKRSSHGPEQERRRVLRRLNLIQSLLNHHLEAILFSGQLVAGRC